MDIWLGWVICGEFVFLGCFFKYVKVYEIGFNIKMGFL